MFCDPIRGRVGCGARFRGSPERHPGYLRSPLWGGGCIRHAARASNRRVFVCAQCGDSIALMSFDRAVKACALASTSGTDPGSAVTSFFPPPEGSQKVAGASLRRPPEPVSFHIPSTPEGCETVTQKRRLPSSLKCSATPTGVGLDGVRCSGGRRSDTPAIFVHPSGVGRARMPNARQSRSQILVPSIPLPSIEAGFVDQPGELLGV